MASAVRVTGHNRLMDADAAYLAVKARDARFDGRLFVGVTSTGIYCRPICRVRTPKRANCRFFATAAAAECEGFRPCLKCRPEIAPGWSAMDASQALAQQAAAWIDRQAGNGADFSIDDLARRIGITDRHLRRIFADAFGVTPIDYVQTRRLLLAKQLLTDTALPVTQVALASGFGSVRRFNALFQSRYRLNPSALRRTARAGELGPSAPTHIGERSAPVLRLAYRAPYAVQAMLDFFGERAVPGVEAVGPQTMRRTLRVQWNREALNGWIQVRYPVPPASMPPYLELALAPTLMRAVGPLIHSVRRWLDLDAVPEVIDARLRGLPGAGMRLPGTPDGFELAVRAILGQQVTLAAARTLASRLVQRFGDPIDTPFDDLTHLFPAADRMATAAPSDVAALGIIRQRAQAIVALARAVTRGALSLQPGDDPERSIAALCALPGVGDWTAQYIAMRALAWPDAFPASDIAVMKALRVTSPQQALARAEAWRPWRAYAVIRLWTMEAA